MALACSKLLARQAQIHSSKVRTVVLGLSHVHQQGTYTGKVWAVNAFGVLSRTQFEDLRGRQAHIHSSKVRTVVLGLSHIHRQGTYTGKVWAVNAFGVLSRTQVLGCERQAGSDSQQQGAYSRARSESRSQAGSGLHIFDVEV